MINPPEERREAKEGARRASRPFQSRWF